MRLRDKLAVGLMASGAAMTLMACYGGPPCDDDDANCFNFDETAGTETAGTDTDTGAPVETCDPASVSVTLDGALPLMTTGEVAGAPGSNIGSCGGAGDELVYAWTPPAAGSYRVSVESALDAVVYVRDGSPEMCGQELGCATDDPATGNAELTFDLADTDTVTVVVDTASVGAGAFTLTIEAQ